MVLRGVVSYERGSPYQVLEEGGFDVLKERARAPRARRDARALLPHHAVPLESLHLPGVPYPRV